MNEHGVERRRWPRGETRSAAVATPDGSAPIYCVITDINAHGARIEFRREVPPDEFYLIDIGGAVAYQSSIAWRMGCLVGVKFSEQWDLSTEYAPDWLRQ